LSPFWIHYSEIYLNFEVMKTTKPVLSAPKAILEILSRT